MLAQAEHDVTATAILLTTSRSLAIAVSEELENQLRNLQTADVARSSLSNSSFIAVLSNIEEAVALSNMYAPEHLSLYDATLLPKINNAGTVFLGSHSPESAGDYASGPSHVLPTGGAARLRGGLSAVDFVKVITIQELSPSALEELTPAITTLARAEGLEAHARAVEVRSVQ
jgi:histidinol dehydrogenase